MGEGGERENTRYVQAVLLLAKYVERGCAGSCSAGAAGVGAMPNSQSKDPGASFNDRWYPTLNMAPRGHRQSYTLFEYGRFICIKPAVFWEFLVKWATLWLFLRAVTLLGWVVGVPLDIPPLAVCISTVRVQYYVVQLPIFVALGLFGTTVLLALVAPGLTLVSQEDLINLEDSWGIEGEHSCRRKNDQKRQKDAALALEPPPQPPEPAGRNGAKTGSSKKRNKRASRAAVASAPAEPERTRYQAITGAKWETAEEKKEREDWEARMMLDALLLLLCYQIHKHY